jgi:hypothetical protein
MSLRAKEREAARAALAPEIPEPCEIEPPGPHPGHHTHVEGNATVCSCGTVWGCFSFVPDPRYWSDDPAEVAAAQREHQEYVDSISCAICGKRGVIAERDWGASANS